MPGADTTSTAGPQRRRGRLRLGEREAREQEILDAALAELVENGYDHVTMLGIASRAGASKETLYAWFGSRDALVRRLIERSADESAQRITAALARPSDPRETLIAYATGLLRLLLGPGSIALNRAAMANTELAGVLLASGRHRIGPIVASYLATLHERGDLDAPDPSTAYTLLFGLVVQDRQIRVLLGESPPTVTEMQMHAERAVDIFLSLKRPAPRRPEIAR